MPKTIKLGWVSSCIHHRSRFVFCAGVFLATVWLAVSAAQAQTTNYVLGATNLLVGSVVGISSVVLGVTPLVGSWTAPRIPIGCILPL
jgi:hypothetical protein